MTDRIAEIREKVDEGRPIRRIDAKYLLDLLAERDAENERLKTAVYDLGRAVGFMSATRDRIDEYVKTFPEVPTPAPPEKGEA